MLLVHMIQESKLLIVKSWGAWFTRPKIDMNHGSNSKRLKHLEHVPPCPLDGPMSWHNHNYFPTSCTSESPNAYNEVKGAKLLSDPLDNVVMEVDDNVVTDNKARYFFTIRCWRNTSPFLITNIFALTNLSISDVSRIHWFSLTIFVFLFQTKMTMNNIFHYWNYNVGNFHPTNLENHLPKIFLGITCGDCFCISYLKNKCISDTLNNFASWKCFYHIKKHL